MLPHEGDTVPRTRELTCFLILEIKIKFLHFFQVIFYRNSLIVTCFLLIESLLVKALTTCERTPFPWMENLIQLIRRKQFGFIFLERGDDQENYDGNNLIEGKEVTSSPNKTLWKNIGSILDKIVMVLVFVSYVIMILTLIPLHYTVNTNVIEVADWSSACEKQPQQQLIICMNIFRTVRDIIEERQSFVTKHSVRKFQLHTYL